MFIESDLSFLNRFARNAPDNVSCGPAALSTVAAFLSYRFNGSKKYPHYLKPLNVAMIRDMMGTNGTTGTTEKEMAVGLNCFGLKHERLAAGSPDVVKEERMAALENNLKIGNPVLLRGFRHGYRHWMVAVGFADFKRDNLSPIKALTWGNISDNINYDKTGFIVFDPEMNGIEVLSKESIINILAPRGFEIWNINGRTIPYDLSMTWEYRTGSDCNSIRTFSLVDRNAHNSENFVLASHKYTNFINEVNEQEYFNFMEENPFHLDENNFAFCKNVFCKNSFDINAANRILSGYAAENNIEYRASKAPTFKDSNIRTRHKEIYGDICFENLVGFEPVHVELVNTAENVEYDQNTQPAF